MLVNSYICIFGFINIRKAKFEISKTVCLVKRHIIISFIHKSEYVIEMAFVDNKKKNKIM